MGGSSSKGSKTENKKSETTTNAPPAWATPLFWQGAMDASRLYNSGSGGNVYQGERVADLSDTTQNAISGLQNTADNFNNSSLQQLATGETASGQNLVGMASGDYLKQGNPYYRDRLDDEINSMSDLVNSRMLGAGRYGSGANTQVLSKNASSMLLNGLESDYNRAMQNMLTANSQIDSANQSQLDAAGNFFGKQSGANSAALLGGQVLDKQAQDKLNADWQKWSETDNRDWDRLSMLQSAAQGFSGNYGTANGKSKTTSEKKPGLLDTVGGALGTAGNLIGKSDIRAKENIILIGQKNGYPLYEFSYCGRSERYRGVMAQDILQSNPDAVFIDLNDGLYCVDYSQLGFAMVQL